MNTFSAFRNMRTLKSFICTTGVCSALLLLALTSNAFGQSGYGLPRMRYEPVMPLPDHHKQERVQAAQPQFTEQELSATVLIPELKGVLFIDNPAKLQLIAPEIHGVQYDSDRPYAFAHTKVYDRIVAKYLGRPFSIGDLTKLQKEIQDLYKRSNLPVIGVIAPNQDVESGSIQLLMIEGRVGRVLFQGNQWFTSENMYSHMRTRRGHRIREDILNEDLRWLNRSPFRDVSVELQPGDDTGRCDLLMKVQDDFPIRGSFGYMDNGTASTGIERVQFGVTHGNLWKRDHVANYTFNATPNFENVKVHMGSYMIPFRNRDMLTVFGYYGTMIPKYELPIFSGKGEVWQTSFRYSKLLNVRTTRSTRSEKRFTFGFDFKDTNSNLDFGGIRVSDSSAQVSQFVFGYSRTYVSKKGYIGFDTNLVWSPGKMSSNNRNENFEQLREGAKSRYVYATMNIFATRYLNKKFQWNVKFNGQWAGGRLLPIEEMGLGGENSVRGYNTYATNSDSGWTLTNELATRFKPLGANKILRKTPLYCSTRKVEDEYQLFAFADAGGGWNHGTRYYEKKYEQLYGAGVGARYNFGPWIRLEAAYGWQLKDLDYNNYNDRAHVTFVISR